MSLLEGLEDIEWHQLHHAYGDASNIPDQIRALLSAEREERDNAFENLLSSICHQGSVYDSTVQALPFLLEIFQSEDAPDREQLAVLIAVIASGGSGFAEDSEIELDTEQANLSETEIGVLLRRMMHPFLSEFVPYLSHPDPYIRQPIFGFLSLFPEKLPLLEVVLQNETDEENQEVFSQILSERNEQ